MPLIVVNSSSFLLVQPTPRKVAVQV